MTFVVRKETPSDASAIETLIAEAFRHAAHASGTEQFIVNALRDARQLTLSLVAETDGALIGHVAISPVRISDGTPRWYGLGPIAVAPASQRQGVGSHLTAKALTELERSGAAGCVVLGEPEFYGRFGFRTTHSLVLPGVPPDYFQVIQWREGKPEGVVCYHEAFNAIG